MNWLAIFVLNMRMRALEQQTPSQIAARGQGNFGPLLLLALVLVIVAFIQHRGGLAPFLQGP
jgi:hypothetical protein